ncbi:MULTISPECIES: TRAP transporter large permease [Rhodobacterales]|jgi:tripartite ATP-independent transporter DctM subunit|uniref:TRAP transporter large permease protein n=1 Tax=Phaeobacter gallaeciensis TaxID=60890 RepID=A0A1B0ZRK2_9RHOB|nr:MULTISPECIES: TRAP transporter large permease [Phaeobacter]MDF1771973.1 TRAP transporter large permease [Pseudophaeobacter sp. bin_em_oilr2.035]MEE2632888.1 TRAP transporter large permease [Pseudomonadota bacterium]ANP36780.1 TRAP-type C4-dicarboxylate transport system, large permease component [Phaeobacter gallaeciensis]MDE4060460.1 TRAP transporter large permease [Phaeobacter gallaeciensis]MDE4098580.1 TRAP transporter large permease [Phaeobacter gallaeciensis]
MITFLALLCLLALFMVFRMPIAFAMGLVGFIGLALQLGWRPAFAVLERIFFDSSSSFILVAIPLFILMAELLTSGDVTRRAIHACQCWIGHVKGGLAMATVASSVLLAALVGSSTASTAAMAASAFPEMRNHNYADRLAAAVVSVGGTLAVVVPPSIVLVVYGVLTETSIGQLFIAGIVPGLLTASGLALVIKIIATRTDQAPKGDPFQLGKAVKASRHVIPMGLLMVGVIGAIYGGVASPSEAAALGVMGSLIIVLVQRSITFVGLSTSVSAAIRATVMIVAIVTCSAIFANYLAFTRITHALLEFASTTDLPRAAILAFMVLILLVMGMFMDQLAILSLAMPLAFPTAMALGYDPVWFGIVVTKTVEIGLLTPPLGLNAYVASAQTGVALGTIFRGIVPFLLMELVVLVVLLCFPEITLWLPSLMLG